MTRDWWKLMLDAGEVALSAPWVIYQRTARWEPATPPSARQRREATRMVTEKWEAGVEGQLHLWNAAWQLQQDVLADLWGASLGTTSFQAFNRRLGPRVSRAVLRGTQRSLVATRRRVRANARRLRGK